MNTLTTGALAEPEKIDAETIEFWCIDYISRTLNIPAEEIDPQNEFHTFGLDSAIATAMILELEDWLHIEVPPSVIFEQVTIGNLVSDLTARLAVEEGKRHAA